MEKNNIPNNQLCFITVVFPYTDDNVVLDVKKNISQAVSQLSKVKVEMRLTEMRDTETPDNINQNHDFKP